MQSLSLHTVPVQLYHATIETVDLPKCGHALIKLCLFPTLGKKDGTVFFSFTRTAAKISMVIEERALSFFPPGVLQIMAEPWRALSIVNPHGFGESTPASLRSMFQQRFPHILLPMFFVSTAQTDFVLVMEKDLPNVLIALSVACHVTRHFNAPAHTEISSSSSSSTDEDKIFNLQVCEQHLISYLDELPSLYQPATNPEWTLCEHLQLYLSNIPKDDREAVSHSLLLAFLYLEEVEFFSFTETEEEISLFMDHTVLSQFNINTLCSSDTWIPLKRSNNKLNLSEIGVISSISQTLSQANIPILYWSTFYSSYVMVRSCDIVVAKLWLQASPHQVRTLQKCTESIEVGE